MISSTSGKKSIHAMVVRVATPLVMLVALLGVGAPVLALDCGYQNARACGVLERLPSCDRGLVERAGRCVSPAPPPQCGGQNERACLVTERLPSCNHGLVERAGRCVSPTPCGAQGQRACLVVERLPSCDRNLIEINGRCAHPACGRVGDRACRVNERIPSCDDNLVERNGRCVDPSPASPPGRPAVGTPGSKTGFETTRPGNRPPPRPRPPAPSSCPGGGAIQSFNVREACGQQPPALWFPKTITGCTFADAVRSFPPSPLCRYVR